MKSIVNYRTFRVASAILLLSVVSISATTHEQCDFKSLRLPQRVKPTHYDLLLRLPDLNAATYEGQVKIDLIVGELHESCPVEAVHCSVKQIFCRKPIPFGCDQKEIILNANSPVAIRDAEFVIHSNGHHNKTIKSHQICRDTASEMVAIRFNKRIKDNSKGQLIINFQARVGFDETGDGIFKSTWRKGWGHEYHTSLASKFMPASARRAFPCFDEPMFKSTFDVAIEHHKDLTALANTMAIKEESAAGNTHLVRTSFERTPIMSTHLLAIALGQYDHLEGKVANNSMLMRVFTPPGQQNLGHSALDMGQRAYAALRDFFGIDQPVQKIDILPVEMSAGGALENWGLVTFRHDLLLLDDVEANDNNVQSVLARTMSHVLANNWFGNLVTMKWWDNLWLNEAFAEWFSYTIGHQIEPQLNLNISMVERLIIRGLEADSGSNHPIKNGRLKSVSDIQDSFDDITYFKGGAVLRMLEAYVGRESFKLGIRDYLNKFKYQNTDENDLWTALETRSKLPVGHMMNTWINQVGFPLVSVRFAASGRDKISLRQNRYGMNPNAPQFSQRWLIPINIVVARANQPAADDVMKIVLKSQEQEFSLPDWFDPAKGHWFKLNHNAEGFFRVHYDPEILKLMHEPIMRKQISLLDRLNILDDTRALYKSRKVDLVIVNEILGLFDDEQHPSLLLQVAKLVNMVALRNRSSSDRYPMLTNYFNNAMVKGTRMLLDQSVQDGPTKRETLLALILLNYKPAIEFGRKTQAKMHLEHKTWPQLEDCLGKK